MRIFCEFELAERLLEYSFLSFHFFCFYHSFVLLFFVCFVFLFFCYVISLYFDRIFFYSLCWFIYLFCDILFANSRWRIEESFFLYTCLSISTVRSLRLLIKFFYLHFLFIYFFFVRDSELAKRVAIIISIRPFINFICRLVSIYCYSYDLRHSLVIIPLIYSFFYLRQSFVCEFELAKNVRVTVSVYLYYFYYSLVY